MKTVIFSNQSEFYLVQYKNELSADAHQKLSWLLNAEALKDDHILGRFVGPRKEMITPWSTNAVEIAQQVGIEGIVRIELFEPKAGDHPVVFDPMLQAVYFSIGADTLEVKEIPEPVIFVEDIAGYNQEHGLALSFDEIEYLNSVSSRLNRFLTDSEVYSFAQINSEHCRHKIFNGSFVIDGEEKQKTLFSLIKETSKNAPDNIVSAYSDNVAFIKGPKVLQFLPDRGDYPGQFTLRPIDTVISLKAETHNFPTAVEPFNGAATGSGGEIRDRMAGGIGSLPIAGTAVYMTAYLRLSGSLAGNWEKYTTARDWRYQTPQQILTKASNGASDFGNKFGQPLIVGSVLTYEGRVQNQLVGYDRCVMLAGGVGYARLEDAHKREVQVGDKVILLGGDNYRIGMAGGSVSSVITGGYSQSIELSAVQRSNPEMQKRVYNVIRALTEAGRNPIKMIHDHGAGGHINCFSELLEKQGGRIFLDQLPIGDPTLSWKEVICNESQERMGLIVAPEDVELLQKIAKRERAPIYLVGEVTGEQRIVFETATGERPFDLPIDCLFGSSPKTELKDNVRDSDYAPIEYSIGTGDEMLSALKNVLSLEAVACKDWLTNKVDRSVTGLVAQQQCTGPLQLPLNNVGVVALDYCGKGGIATSLGHAPIPGLIDECAGSILSVAEALTNIVWAPLKNGLSSVVLSANWMWSPKLPHEAARLYRAVEAMRDFCVALGIAVPTGKDSLSMTMRYSDDKNGDEKIVQSPGTVIVTAAGECDDIRKCVTSDLKAVPDSVVLYLNLSGVETNPVGGSSFAQSLGQLGDEVPTVKNIIRFKAGFNYIQQLVLEQRILAGHDISSGGLISALCEMAFAGDLGLDIRLPGSASDVVAQMFCEKPGVLIQVKKDEAPEIIAQVRSLGLSGGLVAEVIGTQIRLHGGELGFSISTAELRQVWFKPSFLLDCKQTAPKLAKERYEHFYAHPLHYIIPNGFSGCAKEHGIDLQRSEPSGLKAAIIRDKGTNGDREMAFALFAAGFDVRDVTMSDLASGRETLSDLSFIVFPGGFSNSDVLGAGRGWAGVFRFNQRAMKVLEDFLKRPDTLSLGVCNGCQLAVELDLLYPEHQQKIKMLHNESGKFESCFVGVRVQENNSVLLKGLSGSQLGIWVAHGEGRFSLPEGEGAYQIPLKYVSSEYPANPNGSDYNAAAVCSADGRHLVMMPHLERSIFPWQWPYHGDSGIKDLEITPWLLAFCSARDWLKGV